MFSSPREQSAGSWPSTWRPVISVRGVAPTSHVSSLLTVSGKELVGSPRCWGLTRGVMPLSGGSPRLPFSVHFLTNESITIDGDTAVGTWRYLQSTVYKGQAVWIAGRYHNDFVRVEGQWKFQHVRIDAMFVTPYEDGWVKTPFLA